MTGKQPFEQVVRDHGGTVLRVCRAVLGPHDAEDAWSETFLAAMRAWPDLPADANVQAWLVTIAHRKAIDLVRARQRRSVPVEQLPQEPTREGVPGARLELCESMAELSERQRPAVVYHHLAGLPYEGTKRSPPSWAEVRPLSARPPPTASNDSVPGHLSKEPT